MDSLSDVLMLFGVVLAIGTGVAVGLAAWLHARRSKRYKAALHGRRSINLHRR